LLPRALAQIQLYQANLPSEPEEEAEPTPYGPGEFVQTSDPNVFFFVGPPDEGASAVGDYHRSSEEPGPGLFVDPPDVPQEVGPATPPVPLTVIEVAAAAGVPLTAVEVAARAGRWEWVRIGNDLHRRFHPMLHTDEVDDRLHEWAETPTHSSDSRGACTPPPPKSKAWNPWSKRADQEGLLPDHFSESKDRKLNESEIEYDLDGGEIWGK
jgi:hypothetical protein